MAIPTLITELSTTAASNAPAGADSPSTLDDIQRAHAAFIAQLRDEKADIGANSDITSLTALTSINGGQLAGLRNLIINGGFALNQRVYVSGAAVGANLYGHDRWKMAASADTYTFSTTANKTTVTIPAGKVLQQVIEGLNLQTGTYCLSWQGTAQAKIGAGSLGASGITGAITGGTNTTIEFAPGTVSDVQLELGSVATPFEQRPYGLELALCQRYYELLGPGGVGGSSTNAAACQVSWKFAVAKRATPTVTHLSNYALIVPGVLGHTATGTAVGSASTLGVTAIVTVTPTPSAADPLLFNQAAEAVAVSAEL